MRNLLNKVTIVTGASSRVRYAAAKLFTKEGAKTIIGLEAATVNIKDGFI